MRDVRLLRACGRRKRLRSGALIACVLVFGLTICVPRSQAAYGDGMLPGPVPEWIVARMVRSALEHQFADAPPGTVVVLFDETVDPEWIPSVTGVSFHLLTREEIYARQRAEQPYYAFTEPVHRETGYYIGLVYGIGCGSSGPNYRFVVEGDNVLMCALGEEMTVSC
jgi:hypothetical protein